MGHHDSEVAPGSELHLGNFPEKPYTPQPRTSTLVGLNRIDAIAEASPRPSCLRACRDARANGSSHQSREQGVVDRQWVVFALESAFFEQPNQAAGRFSHHSGDIAWTAALTGKKGCVVF